MRGRAQDGGVCAQCRARVCSHAMRPTAEMASQQRRGRPADTSSGSGGAWHAARTGGACSPVGVSAQGLSTLGGPAHAAARGPAGSRGSGDGGCSAASGDAAWWGARVRRGVGRYGAGTASACAGCVQCVGTCGVPASHCACTGSHCKHPSAEANRGQAVAAGPAQSRIKARRSAQAPTPPARPRPPRRPPPPAPAPPPRPPGSRAGCRPPIPATPRAAA